jgi:hypothetical protein
LKKHREERKLMKRQEDYNIDNMFENILKLIEAKDQHKKMPIRKFFNNTFSTILNDALFEL